MMIIFEFCELLLLTLEALRGGEVKLTPPQFFWLYIFAPWPIDKSFGTTVSCL